MFFAYVVNIFSSATSLLTFYYLSSYRLLNSIVKFKKICFSLRSLNARNVFFLCFLLLLMQISF